MRGFLTVSIALGTLAACGDIRLEVSADRTNAVYRCGERATFFVRAFDVTTGAPATNGCFVARLDNFGDVVQLERKIDLAKECGAFSLEGTLSKPGFLRFRASPEGGLRILPNAGQGEFNWAVAYDPQQIRPAVPCPDDFDAFWEAAIASYDRDVPQDIVLEPYPAKCTKDVEFYRLTVMGPRGRRFYGSYARPKDLSKGPFQTLFQVPGAGPGGTGWGAPGQVVVFMNVHDVNEKEENKLWCGKYGVSRYAQAGISDGREAYFYYGAILSIRRVFHWAANRPEVDRSRIVYDGTSQGGGFGIIETALCPFIRKSTVFVPAITDLLGFRADVPRRSGWPRLVEEQRPENRAAAERWAPYFDAANFARRIRTPIAFEVGFGDVVCPPHCGYAAYNVCPSSDKRIVHGIGQGHAVTGENYGRLARWRNATVSPRSAATGQ